MSIKISGDFSIDSAESDCRMPLTQESLPMRRIETIEQIAGGIGHDLKNLLTVVQGYIEVAAEQCRPDATMTNYLEKAATALQQSKYLTQQLWQLSKTGTPEKTRFDFRRVLKNTVIFAIGESNVTPGFSIEESLWPVEADEKQIVLAIQNIVADVRQAMPSGGTVETAAGNKRIGPGEHTMLGSGDYIHVSIVGRGPGILPGNMRKNLESFFDADQGCATIVLSIASRIITNHHGRIEAASEPGGGTTYTFFLPAAAADTHGRDGDEAEASRRENDFR